MPCDPGLIASTQGGEWRHAPLSAPLAVQAGDRVEIEGTTAWLVRNGYRIDSREIGEPESLALQPFVGPQSLESVVFFRRHPMPAVSATIQNVAVNQTTGTIRFDFTNGTQREFADFEALQTLANSYDSDVTRAEDLAIVSAVRRSPDGSNLDVCNGVTCTVDGAANVPVSYSGLPD